jgi:4-hydroxybenzoate polyprenyltransferase
MLKRLNIYFKEMYPIIPRFLLGLIVFFEIYFIVLCNNGITDFSVGISEIVGGFTIFSFLCWLRIADDFKDYELDCRLFSHRPLPSGRVTKKDLGIFAGVLIGVTVLLNAIFCWENFLFCIILYTYGSLMAVWFFQKHKIQKSLPMALITHNPVQMIMNIYVISFAIIKYDLPIFTLTNLMAVFTLYFPALIWEVTRKIRAPKDETEYVTYSKLFGYKKATNFALVVTLIDIATNFILVWNINKISVVLLAGLVSWMTYKFIEFKKDPTKFKLVSVVEKYTYIQESIMILTILGFLVFGKI